MSKIQRGNKEAKKPKQATAPHKDLAPSAMVLTPPATGAARPGVPSSKK
ncbi:hypothetical protein WG899_05660 [Paucibacter sp. AS339]